MLAYGVDLTLLPGLSSGALVVIVGVALVDLAEPAIVVIDMLGVIRVECRDLLVESVPIFSVEVLFVVLVRVAVEGTDDKLRLQLLAHAWLLLGGWIVVDADPFPAVLGVSLPTSWKPN